MSKPNASIIVTTYNRPDALAMVLRAFASQTVRNFEVIIADDGSQLATTQLIAEIQPELNYPLLHVWQPDEGFRAAMIRNKAVAVARADYLIFIDGDSIPRPDFVRQHCACAEPGYFVVGNRVLLNENFTQAILREHTPIYHWSLWRWLWLRIQGQCNRISPLISLPLGGLRKMNQSWKGAKTCNLALWRADFLNVNGFDEAYTGWGYEDSDLVIRLLKSGVMRKEGRFALPVFHLWHPEADRALSEANYQRLLTHAETAALKTEQGVGQYLLDSQE